MLRALTDVISVALSYLLAFMALYGTFPNGIKWYGLFLMILIYFMSAIIPVKKTSPEDPLPEIASVVEESHRKLEGKE